MLNAKPYLFIVYFPEGGLGVLVLLSMVLTVQGSTMEGIVPHPSSSEEKHPCDFPSVFLFTLIFRCGFLCHSISD